MAAKNIKRVMDKKLGVHLARALMNSRRRASSKRPMGFRKGAFELLESRRVFAVNELIGFENNANESEGWQITRNEVNGTAAWISSDPDRDSPTPLSGSKMLRLNSPFEGGPLQIDRTYRAIKGDVFSAYGFYDPNATNPLGTASIYVFDANDASNDATMWATSTKSTGWTKGSQVIPSSWGGSDPILNIRLATVLYQNYLPDSTLYHNMNFFVDKLVWQHNSVVDWYGSGANEIWEDAKADQPTGVNGYVGGFLDYTYSLDDDAGGRFKINELTGQVLTTGLNDNQTGAFDVIIRASHGTESVVSQPIRILVKGVNDPPIRASNPPSPINVPEDSSNETLVTLGLSGLIYAPGGGGDEDGQTLSYKINAVPENVEIYKADGSTRVASGAVITLADLRQLKYKTIPNKVGPGILSWTVQDNGGVANGGNDLLNDSIAITVNTVNDSPIRTSNPLSPISALEDSANTTAVPLGLSGLTYGPGGGSDENNQTLSYSIAKIPVFVAIFKADGTSVNENDVVTIEELRQLKYKTVPDKNGIGNFTWNIKDNGGTANGGTDLYVDSLSITVTAVNDSPIRTSSQPTPINVPEDSANNPAVFLGLSGLAYGPGGSADEQNQALSCTITAIPVAMELYKADGVTLVRVGDVLTIEELRQLKYKTVPDKNGTGALTWSIKDNGGTANGGNDVLTESLAVSVTAVNDPPIRTSPSSLSPIGVTEDFANASAVTLGLSGLAYGPGGGGDEANQTLIYSIGSIPNYVEIFKADGSTRVVAGDAVTLAEMRQLTYKTLPDKNGTGVLTWSVKDNGGIANGGIDLFTDSLTITVNSVNDSPIRTSNPLSPISVLEDSANSTAASLGLTTLEYGPGGWDDENGQTLNYSITAIPAFVEIFKADGSTRVQTGDAVTIEDLRQLKYKTIPNKNGSGVLSWTVQDNGGTANGGNDLLNDSIAITVNSVNDSPIRTSNPPSPINVPEDHANDPAVTLGLTGLAYDPGGAADEANQTLSYSIGSIPSYVEIFKADGSTRVVAGDAVTLAELRQLMYKTLPDKNGTGALTWSVKDNGGIANGGIDLFTDSLTITVNSVNDSPIRTSNPLSPISALEDSANTTAVTLGLSGLTYGPGGGSDENNQTLSYAIAKIPVFVAIFKADGTSVNETDVVTIEELRQLKYKTVANRNGTDALTWNVRDNGGTGNGGKDLLVDSLPITITPVNDPPVRTSAAAASITVLEDSANSTAVSLGLTSLGYSPGGWDDESDQALNYSITAVPAVVEIFKVDGSTRVQAGDAVTIEELRQLKYKTLLNKNGAGVLTWNVKDSGGTANGGLDLLRQSLTLTVTAVNDAPTDITLSPASIPENAAANSAVGTFRSVDPDTGNTFTYSLVSGTGDTNNSAFRIIGSTLWASNSFDFETKASYSIRVRTTDQGKLWTEKALLITVTDVNDAPRFVESEYVFDIDDGTRQYANPQANNEQSHPSISRDGRFVSFASRASNLATNDAIVDIFVQDTRSGSVYEVSKSTTDKSSNGDSRNPTITPDGRYVVFESDASNLLPDDVNNSTDIFLRDMQSNTLMLVSASTLGELANNRSSNPSISDDGRYVLFQSDANNLVDGDTNESSDVFLKDLITGVLTRVSVAGDESQANNRSYQPAISGDGTRVAFVSDASNLVSGADINLVDVYVKNLQNGAVVRANTTGNGEQATSSAVSPRLSYDGNLVSFSSSAENLVANDTNKVQDVFLKNLTTGAIALISTSSDGAQSNGSSDQATVSADGRFVSFRSTATNLVLGDTNQKADIFVKDTQSGVTTRVSAGGDAVPANEASAEAFISSQGNLVVFISSATNLVANDCNGFQDVFIRNMATKETTLAIGNVNKSIFVGQVTGVDQDPNTKLNYSLSGLGADAFGIDSLTGKISLSSTGYMDFNVQPTYSLSVTVSDGQLSSIVPLTIQVANGNNRPTDILLSSVTIEENNDVNSAVGVLSVVDPNYGDAHAYELVAGPGSDDNAIFFIDGATLKSSVSFDYETKASYSVRIRATDQGSLFKEKVFTIRISDVDEGLPIKGTASNDAFVATYTGDGISHAWSVTRAGVSVFNGPITASFLSIDGLGGTDSLTIVGRTVSDAFQLDSGEIVVNGAKLRFPRVETVVVSAGAGNDTLTVLSPFATGVAGSFDGGTGLDRIEAKTGNNTWTINGADAGTLNSVIPFLATESVGGGVGADVFVFTAVGKVTGQILGGDGVDTLNLSAKTATHTINLQTKTATSTGGVDGIESFIGGSTSTVIDVFVGPNSDTNWKITGTNTGTLTSSSSGTVAFAGFESVTGGTAVDTFRFENGGNITNTLTGGTATGVSDVVDLTARTDAFDVQIDATKTSITGAIAAYTGIELVKGNKNSGSKISRINSTTTAWAIDTIGQVTVAAVVYSDIMQIVGGPGVDTLTGASLASGAVTWVIDAKNGGTLDIPSNPTVRFANMDNLTGGSGVDVFNVLPTGSLTGALSGGTGTVVNSLNYSQWTTDVTVNLSVSTGANATAIAGLTSNIQLVTGGSGNDTLRGLATQATILVGLDGNDTLISGSQRDLLIGGQGVNLLQGAGSDDLLIAGWTTFDRNREALTSILAEWTSARSFAQRTTNIWGNGTGTRSNGTFYLNMDSKDSIVDTVFADEDIDSLTGGLNQDWFFANGNDLTDFNGSEDRINY